LKKLKELEESMLAPDFWNSQERAQQTLAELKSLKNVMTPLSDALKAVADAEELIALTDEDDSLAAEVDVELKRLDVIVEQLEVQSLLSGPMDHAAAILSVHARDGGIDANDWAEMLLGMYINWAKNNSYEVELLDRADNEEAGITQATIAIRGDNAFGYLKGEEGTHRLVRISPFNAEGKRQTSFAAVDVSPEVGDVGDVDIADKDVREDTYRASGAGGQHVNKTDSAVRLTHIPTGIVAACQTERSQHQNRAKAWKMLRARLARVEIDRREAEKDAKYKNKARVGFGSQIRNYFLHPDQRVKDARTGFLVGSFNAVLSGELQGFLDAFLRWRMKSDGTMAEPDED
jgi:peptide chain release factor 2